MARRLPAFFLSGIALGCALIGAAGQLGRFDDAADAINQFILLWLSIGLGAGAITIVATRAREWRVIIAVAVLVAIGVAAFVPRGPIERAAPDSPVALRLVQFNLDRDNADPDGTAAWILGQHADMLVLEEGMARGGEVVARLRAAYPFASACARGHCSTLILSRVPPRAVAPLAHGDPENRGGLSAVSATFDARSGPFTLVAVHLIRPWPFGDQRSSLTQLGRYLRLLPADRTIVAGDFNMTPWAFAMRRQDAAIGLPRLTRMLPSWPATSAGPIRAPWPVLAIDHVYAGRGWRLVSLRRGPALGSDHYPLVIELASAR